MGDTTYGNRFHIISVDIFNKYMSNQQNKCKHVWVYVGPVKLYDDIHFMFYCKKCTKSIRREVLKKTT